MEMYSLLHWFLVGFKGCFSQRGNIILYALCSSNQSHSNIFTPQEIQSLPTKQMKICQQRTSCLPKGKGFMTGDSALSEQHVYVPLQTKHTLPELLNTQQKLQRAFTVRMWSILWVRTRHRMLQPTDYFIDPHCYTGYLPEDIFCDIFTVIYFLVILIPCLIHQLLMRSIVTIFTTECHKTWIYLFQQFLPLQLSGSHTLRTHTVNPGRRQQSEYREKVDAKQRPTSKPETLFRESLLFPSQTVILLPVKHRPEDWRSFTTTAESTAATEQLIC